MGTFREAFAEALRANRSRMNGTAVYRLEDGTYEAMSPLSMEGWRQGGGDGGDLVIAPITDPSDWLGRDYEDFFPDGTLTEEQSLEEVDHIIDAYGGEAQFLAAIEG